MAAELLRERQKTDQRVGGPSDYLAAERTFLAWIRTGLALMGLGFVVARFGLFLRTLQFGPLKPTTGSYGLSLWIGTALIVLWGMAAGGAMRNYLHLIQDLKDGGHSFERPSSLAVGVAIVLAIVGLTLAIYLISVREPTAAYSQQGEEKTIMSNPDSGIITLPGHRSVEQTVQKLQEMLQAKGVKLFAVIDHSGEAKQAGLQMQNTKLLIFGNPKAGTPLMVASPTAAIDLPLKILVWEDGAGTVQISYNSPRYLQNRHALPDELVSNIAVVESLAAAAAK